MRNGDSIIEDVSHFFFVDKPLFRFRSVGVVGSIRRFLGNLLWSGLGHSCFD